VRIDLESRERIEAAEVVEAVPERVVVHPGESLGVRLTLRPYRADEYVREVKIEVPSELPEGRLDLVVADGVSWTAYDLQMRPFRPGSFADEIRLFHRLIPSDTLVLAFERRQVGVAMNGGTLSVPPSLVVQLRSALGPNVETTEYGVVAEIEEEMPTSVVGALRIPLTVRWKR
jgi:hypothetical protein